MRMVHCLPVGAAAAICLYHLVRHRTRHRSLREQLRRLESDLAQSLVAVHEGVTLGAGGVAAAADVAAQELAALKDKLSAAQEELKGLQEQKQAAARLKREARLKHEATKVTGCPSQETASSSWSQFRYTTGLPIPLHAIGVVRSCYEDCQGTPRQPGLVPLARATIVMCAGISPAAFDGFALHSHAWVIFLFHANTNGAKTLAARTSRGETFPAKIRPPRGQGRGQGGARVKVGVLATRTPHRPNPVGLSLVRIEAVDAKKRTIVISGADVIDGSPVLDLKPYLPPYDAPLPGVEVFTPLERWYGADVSPMRAVLGARHAARTAPPKWPPLAPRCGLWLWV